MEAQLHTYGRQCMNVYELIDGCKSRAERQPRVTRAVGGVWLLDQTHQRFFYFINIIFLNKYYNTTPD